MPTVLLLISYIFIVEWIYCRIRVYCSMTICDLLAHFPSDQKEKFSFPSYALHLKCWCNCSLFGLSSYGIAAIAPFSHRLAFDNMPEEIQRLRCKVNFQALVFVPHVRSLGEALVSRLRNSPSSSNVDNNNYLQKVTNARDLQGTGKFVVLHLRFDKVCSLIA